MLFCDPSRKIHAKACLTVRAVLENLQGIRYNNIVYALNDY